MTNFFIPDLLLLSYTYLAPCWPKNLD